MYSQIFVSIYIFIKAFKSQNRSAKNITRPNPSLLLNVFFFLFSFLRTAGVSRVSKMHFHSPCKSRDRSKFFLYFDNVV